MISIDCTHCRQHLEMDDAFAGGVCRCQYCGTIQTVPSKLKAGARKSSSSKGSSSKALYKKGASGSSQAGAAAAASEVAMGTGLDELAEVVATSSGLSRGSLNQPSQGNRVNPVPVRKGLPMPALIGGGGVIGILLVLVIYLAVRTPPAPPVAQNGSGSSARMTAAPGSADEAATPVAVDSGPTFAGLPLGDVGDVVYVLDRSQANEQFFDAMKVAAYASARSLGRERKFQIVFWQRGDEGIVSYPETGLAAATPNEVDAAKRRFEDVVAYGATELKPTLERAVKPSPGMVILVTAKGFSLGEETVSMVQSVTGGKLVKVHTVSLGEGDSDILRRVAALTGGEYRTVPLTNLRNATR